MRLTILNVAYPFAPVGVDAVGGAEQVLTQLDHALTRAGHRSIVIACEGSSAAGILVEAPCPRGTLSETVRARHRERYRQLIDRTLDRFAIGAVHLHGIDFHAYLPREGVPMLATLHLPPAWYPREAWRIDRADTYVHCVSATQHRAYLREFAAFSTPTLLPPIGNGVDAVAFTNLRKRRYALALGRVCPEKNLHTALDAGTLAGVPVLIGGQVFPYEAHEQYFRCEIVPRLGGMHRFLGPLPFARKRRLLAGARCLLVPTLAEETSSLVAMEAFASGTPVIAFPSGALAEIVEPGITGFLVRSTEEMAQAIAAARTICTQTCRDAARTRFSLRAAVQKYLDVYERLARRTYAHAQPAAPGAR